MKTVEVLFNKVGVYLFFFLLISCSGDDVPDDPSVPENPNPPGSPTVETCLITTVDSPTLSYTITRNDLGLPTKLTYTKYNGQSIDRSVTFEYDESNKLIKLGHETIFFTYKYDDLNRVISEKFEKQPNSPVPYLYDTERTFTYNEKGHLDSAYYTPEVYERYVYDDDGNMIKRFVKYYNAAEFLSNEYLTFDNKKNPFYEFSFSHELLLNLSGIEATVTNFNPVRHAANIIQSRSYTPEGTPTLYNATYNYNDSGYPISTSTVSFGYQCK